VFILKNNKTKREGFSSGLAVFLATLGSAVGLGNIWKFPYLTGMYGGGAFLLVYFVCILFVGLPVMISEFYIGRSTRKNAVGAFKQLKPGSPWKYVGVMGAAAAYLIMFFYSCVAGWVYSYVFKAAKGDFAAISKESAGLLFKNTAVGPWPPIIWQFIVIAVVSAILISGVKKGIERVTKVLMPVLFILIVICAIRALTLPGAFEGLKFLFSVDFSKLTAGAILTALGLAFFKLSLGMGTMTTYASYFTDESDMINTSAKVALSDTVVSLLAGIAIFPAVFSFNMEPGGGPGLLFMTIPLVFSKIPLGNVLLVAFFFLTSIAATTAMISMVEVPVAYLSEEKGVPRKISVIINCLAIFAVGILATLSADLSSPLGKVTVFGKSFFDLFDFVSSNILLPLGGFCIALLAGYFIPWSDIEKELSNRGKLNNFKLISAFRFIIRYITPVLLIIVFLNSIGLIKL